MIGYKRTACAGTLMLTVFVASPVDAQPKNHIGAPLAEALIQAGCVMSEAEALAALKRKGYGVGDLQAQANALVRGRYLGSSSDGRWKLIKWHPCT